MDNENDNAETEETEKIMIIDPETEVRKQYSLITSIMIMQAPIYVLC